jgi:hypothetical protein
MIHFPFIYSRLMLRVGYVLDVCTQFPGGVMRPTPTPGMGYEHRTHAKIADIFDVPTWDIGWLHCDSDLLVHDSLPFYLFQPSG